MPYWRVILIALVISACQQPKSAWSGEVAQLDSLLQLNERYQSELAQSQALPLAGAYRQMDSLNRLLTGPLADQEDKQYWTRDLAPLTRIHAQVGKFIGDNEKLQGALSYNEAQLKALRNSLVDGKIKDADSVRRFMAIELGAFGESERLYLKRNPEEARQAFQAWDSLYPNYQSLAEQRRQAIAQP